MTCGHTAEGFNGNLFTCELEPGHPGWHEQSVQLRDGIERTNWGDDGLSIHASKDEARRQGGKTDAL